MEPKTILKGVLPFVFLAIGGLAAKALVASADTAQRADLEAAATPVEILIAAPSEQRVSVHATGTVEPARSVGVVPEVGGRVVWVSDQLMPGGRLSQGSSLAKIDTRDLNAALEGERSRLRQAELELQLEKGRQEVAEREWELLGDSAQHDALALRRPHLGVAEQSVVAARGAVERAELNVQRASLRAPFNAIIIDEKLDVGQVVGPGAPVATLVGTDRFWVRVSVPVERLGDVILPGDNGKGGSQAQVVQVLGDGQQISRAGQVLRLGGQLDPATRTATLIIGVDDPMDTSDGQLPLLPGAYVEVAILGPPRADAFTLPRRALSDGDRVWLDDGGKLASRRVTIGWGDDTNVFVTGGLTTGERVITTLLPLPIEGMPVRALAQQ